MKSSVHDPWRTGKPAPAAKGRKPARKPAAPATTDDDDAHVVGTATSDHPLDADLKPERQFLLRAPGQDYALLVTNAVDPASACHVLLRAAHNPALELVLITAGFKLAPKTQAKPSGFMLTDGEDVLWHPQAVDVADGFRRLVQTLLRAGREERGFRDRLTQLGLSPIMP